MARTIIEVIYPQALGKIGIRGAPPLQWETSTQPRLDGDHRHLFELDVEDGELLEFKVIRDDKDWSKERNYAVLAGTSITVRPYFDVVTGSLEPEPRRMHSAILEREMMFEVFLPPSYKEQTTRRYPVLYAQDGHALFASRPSNEPSWNMDTTVNQLVELGAIEEVIIVGVHVNPDRIALLSPTEDPQHGGGRGPKMAQFLVEELKPFIDSTFRTLTEREHTALMGSSMGGLFSFFAVWSRPDVFGKAACLSSSFWWNDRFMLKHARNVCAAPKPWLYLDSGAPIHPMEHDANLKDGYADTLTMARMLVRNGYEAGRDLRLVAYPGHAHNAESWAARLATPLQLLFQRRG